MTQEALPELGINPYSLEVGYNVPKPGKGQKTFNSRCPSLGPQLMRARSLRTFPQGYGESERKLATDLSAE
jgi:hypothetical protein